MQKNFRYILAALSCAAGVLAMAGGVRAEPSSNACADDPNLLGLSRVVEIDTAGGPIFGGSHKGNDFLERGEVVLTFDDGPMRAYTRTILKALAAHCTRATFFMVGRMAAADPAMVKEVIAAGHTVGAHTWSHQNLRALTFVRARNEFELGFSAVSKAAGQPIAPFFRYPFLSENKTTTEHARKRGIASFFIDVDSKDFQTRDAKRVVQRVMGELAVNGKGIILLHDIQPSTANGIKTLLDSLHAKGYRVVHMVPVGAADTIAEFDTPADKAIAAKAAAAKEKPLADRSMLWTAAKPGEDDTFAPAAPPPTANSAQPAETSTDGKDTRRNVKIVTEHLPWLEEQQQIPAPKPAKPASTASISKKPAQKRPQRRQVVEELPWQMRIFAQ